MSSPEAEISDLAAGMLNVAQQLLREFGEFHPFGGYVRSTHEIVHVGFDGDGSAKERAQGLKDSFLPLVDAGDAIAVAIVCNVEMNGEHAGSAIRVYLEHRDWIAAYVFYPYEFVDGKLDVKPDIFKRARPYYWPERPPAQ
jgi:hypothetical protein